MRRPHIALVLLAALSASAGCRHLDTDAGADGKADAAMEKPGWPETSAAARRETVRAQLRRASELMKEGDLRAAQNVLAPVLGGDVLADEVADMAAQINRLRVQQSRKLSKAASEGRALYEVESRLRLPASYGETVVISREKQPHRFPPGPMEKLVERKVSMHLDDAPVETLIRALSDIEGLNIIADKALTRPERDPDMPQPTLTLHVDNLPLKEILQYIARNMGIAFHIREDVVWVTRSKQDPGAPQPRDLETRIYRLQKGFIPVLAATQK